MSKTDWSKLEAPSLAEFEDIAHAAYRRLPARFRALTGDLLIRIEDFPTDEVLDSLDIESPFDLLGLYSGVDLARKSVMDVSARARHGVPLPPPDPRLLGRARGDARRTSSPMC